MPALLCPKGHALEIKITPEITGALVSWERMWYDLECDLCSNEIKWDEARYCCQACDYDICTRCGGKLQTQQLVRKTQRQRVKTKESVARSLLHAAFGMYPNSPLVMAGDVLLSGPDRWGIHHMILAQGPMTPAIDAVTAEVAAPGMTVYSFPTVESSDLERGVDTAWKTGHRFVFVDSDTNQLMLLGEMVDGCDILYVEDEAQPVKVLQHPLRPGRGGPAFDFVAFGKAVTHLSQTSKTWSLATALRSLSSTNEVINAAPYLEDSNARAKLFKDLSQSWDTPPICSSVVVKVWQCYFLYACGAERTDAAVQYILQYMPLRCDLALPSQVVQALSRCGWIVMTHCENLSAAAGPLDQLGQLEGDDPLEAPMDVARSPLHQVEGDVDVSPTRERALSKSSICSGAASPKRAVSKSSICGSPKSTGSTNRLMLLGASSPKPLLPTEQTPDVRSSPKLHAGRRAKGLNNATSSRLEKTFGGSEELQKIRKWRDEVLEESSFPSEPPVHVPQRSAPVLCPASAAKPLAQPYPHSPPSTPQLTPQLGHPQASPNINIPLPLPIPARSAAATAAFHTTCSADWLDIPAEHGTTTRSCGLRNLVGYSPASGNLCL